MSTIVINHCDLDAVGCKIVLDIYNFPYDKMLTVNYGDITMDSEEIYSYDKIICTDFSLPTTIVEKLLSLGKFVDIYDHHDYTNDESTKGLLTLGHKNFRLYHDLTKCGTSIVAKEFKPPKYRFKKNFSYFINLVNIYDMYQKQSPLWEDAQNCNRILWGCLDWSYKDIHKFDFICSYWINKIKNNNEWQWSTFEQEKINRAIQIENEEYKKAMSTYSTYIDNKGIKYGVAVASKKISIVASMILDNNKDIVYLIMMNTFGSKWGKISLRTSETTGFDCTQFEECHGHKEASGGEVSEDLAKALYKGKKFLTYKNII
jgi:hypothetical protein